MEDYILLRAIREKVSEKIFLLCAISTAFSLLLIIYYIFARGVPAIAQIGLLNFILGMEWAPKANIFGIFPMIVASLYVTAGAIVIGVPIGILTAVFFSEIAPAWLANILRPVIELLAAIPSVVYGFFGLVVIVPIIDAVFKNDGGNSLLAAVIILGIMILPTIISITETSIREVDATYKEASLALGATKIRTIFKVIIPTAKSGIFAGIVLGIGRAIGETMAVMLVAGNAAVMPHSLLDRARTLTVNCALEMGYASGLHADSLIATGVVLFTIIIILNLVLTLIKRERI